MDSLICRICLQSLENKYKVELSETFKGTKLFVSINSITNIEIKENDGFPSAMCFKCYKEFQTAMEFKEKCELSNIKLREYETRLNTPVKNEIECIFKHESDMSAIEVEIIYKSPETVVYETQVNLNDEAESPNSLNLSCTRCNVVFKTPKTLSIHRTHNKCEPKHFECDDCGETFNSKCKIAVHWKKTHYLNKLICPKCKKQCKSYTAFNKHKLKQSCLKLDNKLVSVDGIGRDRVFNCKECPYETKHVLSMLTHTRVHSGERPYKCSLCPKSFTQIGTLQVHQQSIHKLLLTQIECPICNIIVTSKSRLRLHINRKHNNPIINCTVCNKSLRRNSLKTHMLRHTDSKNYTCEVCAKSYYSSAELCTHRRKKHDKISKKKRFKCELCDYETDYPKSYTKHVEKHQDGKPFCKVCFVFCKDDDGLKNHVLIHSEEKKFECQYCLIKFHTIKAKRNHVWVKHTARFQLKKRLIGNSKAVNRKMED